MSTVSQLLLSNQMLYKKYIYLCLHRTQYLCLPLMIKKNIIVFVSINVVLAYLSHTRCLFQTRTEHSLELCFSGVMVCVTCSLGPGLCNSLSSDQTLHPAVTVTNDLQSPLPTTLLWSDSCCQRFFYLP